MAFATTIQLLLGAHSSGGAGAGCIIDWPRQRAWIYGTNTNLSNVNIITGVETAFGNVPAQCNANPLGLDQNGNIYLPNGGLHSGGQTQIDGTTIMQLTTSTYPNGDFGSGGFANVPYAGQQFMLDTGVGGGIFGELAEINVTLGTVDLFTGPWPVAQSASIVCSGPANANYGFLVNTGNGASITLSTVEVSPTPSVTQIATIIPTQIDAGWTALICDGMCIDQTDGNPIISVSSAGATPPSYVAKLNKTSGAIIWKTSLPAASPVTALWQYSSILSQILYVATPSHFGSPPVTVTTINTSSGASSSYTSNLAGMTIFAGQMSNDTLGVVCTLCGYTEGAGSPAPRLSTPSSWVTNWALLYVASPSLLPTIVTRRWTAELGPATPRA